MATAALALQGLSKRCDRCGTANDASARFCHQCGWDLASTPLVSSAQLGIAGFWVRLGAYLLDVILLGIVVAIGVGAAAIAGVITQGNQLWVNVAAQVGTIVYFTVAVGMRGASAGKWVLGLRIVRADGSRVSVMRSFFRYAVLTLVFLPSGLGVILAPSAGSFASGQALFSKGFTGMSAALLFIGLLIVLVFVIWLAVRQDKRGWHDLLAGTRVVRVR
jgi:uncharacterized RDD family membrane protein YckC